MQRKILYLMHVDWNWIKQRPHFLAEKLALKFELRAVYPVNKKRQDTVSNPTRVKTIPTLYLPLRRYRLIHWLNKLLQKSLIWLIVMLFQPDIIWLTFPEMYAYAPATRLKHCRLVYDCMDDALGFEIKGHSNRNMLQWERELVTQADAVFVSSQNLGDKLVGRGCPEGKLHLVRNAFDGKVLPPAKEQPGGDTLKIGYTGTISEWLDINALVACLEAVPELEFHLIGPICTEVPTHPRLLLHGPVAHAELGEAVADFACMIMPFKVNPLIESVDPVKLYEYINYHKPIISVYYAEVQRFADFVYFYQDLDSLLRLVQDRVSLRTPKYSNAKRLTFLAENTWQARSNQIEEILNSILK